MEQFASSGVERADVKVAGCSIARPKFVCELDDVVRKVIKVPVSKVEEISDIVEAETIRLISSEQNVPLGLASNFEVRENESLFRSSVLNTMAGGTLFSPLRSCFERWRCPDRCALPRQSHMAVLGYVRHTWFVST